MEKLDHSVAYDFFNPIPASLDEGWFILMPPSTAYDAPKIKYWHPQECTGGCVCEPEEPARFRCELWSYLSRSENEAFPMSADHHEPLLDEDAGLLVRPYTVTGGRTEPSVRLDRLTLVWSTKKHRPAHLDAELAEVMLLCHQPMSVAEICAHMKLPSGSIRVLVADLIELGAVQTLDPEPYDEGPSKELLEALLHGLQRRL